MSHNIIIQEGALIVSDAHFSPSRLELYAFVEALYLEQIQTPQLILMGDIFDALFGSIQYTYEKNQKIIAMLEQISKRVEVIYLEGNHDFNLKAVFSHMKIFPIEQQPISCTYHDKKVYLAHGDFDGPLGYRVYTAIIRNSYILPFLRLIDNLSQHSILNYVYTHLAKKEDCNGFTGFEEFIAQRIEKRYKCDYFIEGHYHQNRKINLKNCIYINLAAFACNQRYFTVKSLEDKELLEEKTFSKG